jgi:Flp pilus assembly protein TadG
MSKRWWRHATGPVRTIRDARPRTRGQALVELAIVLPVLLLLMLAALDLGRIFYARIAVENAAREGALEASINPSSYASGQACSASNRIVCAATNEAANGAFVVVAPADVTRTCTNDCSKAFGARVTVSVTGHFRLITPIMWIFTGGPDVTLVSTADADIVVIPAGTGVTPTPTPSPTPTPTPVPTPTPSGSTGPTASPTASPTPTPVPTPTCAPPAASFTYSQQNKNRPVVFVSTSTPSSGSCAITYWRWEFGDGQTDAGNVQTVSHTYPAQGTSYTVVLTVTNPGSTTSYTTTITTR